MYKYIILGSGKQGTAIAYDLARFGDASKIILSDIDENRAKKSSDRVNKLLDSDCIIHNQLDIYNKEDILDVLQEIDVMISAVPYFHNLYFD